MPRHALDNLLLAAALALAPLAARAHDYKVGDIQIVQPWSRATPKGAPVAAGYMVLKNDGTTPDRLLGGETDAAASMQVHEMSMDNGVMKMRALPNGLEIAPGATVELKPGGYHVMFMSPTHPFAKDEKVKVTLTFEHAGKVPVEFLVGDIGGPMPKDATMDMPGMDHGAMDHSAMDHGAMEPAK